MKAVNGDILVSSGVAWRAWNYKVIVGCKPCSHLKNIFSMWISAGGIPVVDRNLGLSAQQSSKEGDCSYKGYDVVQTSAFPSGSNLTWNLMRIEKALEPLFKSNFPSSNYQCHLCLDMLVVPSFFLLFSFD